jgi:N-acetylglucosaminyldiphosphoundecaprenol N-acetyl-beta-D-mannosaminyltransferase
MKSPDSRAFANVLGVQIDAIDMQIAVSRLIELLHNGRKSFICVAGVHGVMESRRFPKLRQAYAEAAMTVPDGMPLVWVGHLQGKREMRRVTGPDLMLQMFGRPEMADATHFLYGGREGVADELRSRLEKEFPHTRIVGTYTPPFRDLNAEEELAFVSKIAELKPDIIWVGISCPRQEQFMSQYLPVLETKLMFGVGAAFDYHTGRIRDCSQWIKDAGLQWLHRLMQDPRRLWHRYLSTNPAFLWHITWQLLGLRQYSIIEPSFISKTQSTAHGRL